eukprot:3417774-Amphidinium_carterae.1
MRYTLRKQSIVRSVCTDSTLWVSTCYRAKETVGRMVRVCETGERFISFSVWTAFVVEMKLLVPSSTSWLDLMFWYHATLSTSLNIMPCMGTMRQPIVEGLNITFPHLRCDEVSVDTVDSLGENQVTPLVKSKLLMCTNTGSPLQEPALVFAPFVLRACVD